MYKLSSQMHNNSALVQKLLDSTKHRRTSLEIGNESNRKIVGQINTGSVQIFNSNDDFESYIDHRKKAAALQSINQSQQYYNYQRDYKIMKGIPLSKEITIIPKKGMLKKIKRENQIIQMKKSEEQVKKEFNQKLKQWESQKQKVKQRKRSLEQKKKLMQDKSQEMSLKDKEAVQQFLKLQKKKMIECRIKDIEQRKRKRQERQKSINRSKSMPKFVENQERFKDNMKQKQIQAKILLKNRKSNLQMKMQQIKQHEKAYIDRIKQRLNIRSDNGKLSKSKSIEIHKNPQEFNIFKKDLTEKKKLEEKLNRIKKFQSKVRLLPLKIDANKKRQAEIMGDKLKNKMKYNFLSQKALSDDKIYEEFKNFDININKKQLGNQYFEQVKSLNKVAKRKVSSLKVLPSKVQYKDYLKERRQSLPQSKITISDNSDVIMTKNKKKGKSFLMKESEQYEEKVFDKIKQLKKVKNYKDSIQMQRQIDGNYMKALKAKLALANLS